MAFTSTNATLTLAVAQAICHLTRPLIVSYPATTIIKLQLVLEANLTALFAPSWVPSEPLRGTGRRCLTLSPHCLPPRAIYSACLAAGVQWFDWIALLGGKEFDFFVDPGCISVRFGKKNSGAKLMTVWSNELTAASQAKAAAAEHAKAKAQADARALGPFVFQRQSLAQQLSEADKEEDEELFAMIADEVSAPTWMTPILDQFPVPVRTESPLSDASRPSSRSSNSTSGFSRASSSETIATSVSTSSGSSKAEQAQTMSRRERARQARVFIDTSKTDVTPYDGGKTTVLTGGVMLGAPAPKASRRASPTKAASSSWRSRA